MYWTPSKALVAVEGEVSADEVWRLKSLVRVVLLTSDRGHDKRVYRKAIKSI